MIKSRILVIHLIFVMCREVVCKNGIRRRSNKQLVLIQNYASDRKSVYTANGGINTTIEDAKWWLFWQNIENRCSQRIIPSKY